MRPNIIAILKTAFAGCVCKSCEEPECKLELNNVPSTKVILNIDCIAEQQSISGKRCDYVIAVANRQSTFVIPVEFKTNRVVVEDVKQQLEGGVRFIQQHWQGQLVCHPVLVSKSISRSAIKKLQQTVIQYNGGTARIRRVSCNQPLQWNKVTK